LAERKGIAVTPEYAEFVASRTAQQGSLKMNLLHAAVGLSGEAGELLDVCKKMWIYHQSIGTQNKEGVTHGVHLREELGDALFYIQMACNDLGCTMQELIAENVDKLTKRYPVKYTHEAALLRADKQGE
jgi:NTP pyrophosphatase (non-canonical NTP hydrolase)